jgi:hypothetical protein
MDYLPCPMYYKRPTVIVRHTTGNSKEGTKQRPGGDADGGRERGGHLKVYGVLLSVLSAVRASGVSRTSEKCSAFSSRSFNNHLLVTITFGHLIHPTNRSKSLSTTLTHLLSVPLALSVFPLPLGQSSSSTGSKSTATH